MGSVEPTKFTWVTNSLTGARTRRVSRDTKWKARYRDPQGRARSKTFDRKFDAEKFVARIDTDIQRDDWVDPQRRRAGFDEWADAWLATTARLSVSTRRGYDKTLRLYVRPTFGWPPPCLDRLARSRAVRRLARRTRPQPEDLP